MNLTQFYDLPEVHKLRNEYTQTPYYFQCNRKSIGFPELLRQVVLENSIENITIPLGVSIDTFNAAVDAIHAIDRTAFKLHHRLGVDHG